MRFSTQAESVSYFKAHAAEVIDRITKEREPIIITKNGEARAVLLDIHSYEEMQSETQSLLNVLALTEEDIKAGRTVPIEDVMAEFGVEATKP